MPKNTKKLSIFVHWRKLAHEKPAVAVASTLVLLVVLAALGFFVYGELQARLMALKVQTIGVSVQKIGNPATHYVKDCSHSYNETVFKGDYITCTARFTMVYGDISTYKAQGYARQIVVALQKEEPSVKKQNDDYLFGIGSQTFSYFGASCKVIGNFTNGSISGVVPSHTVGDGRYAFIDIICSIRARRDYFPRT